MSEKEQIIQAIKSLNFESLYHLLDDKRSYMTVSKDLFVSTLQEKIKKCGVVKGFEEVIEGTCNDCYKGCVAHKFIAKNNVSLNLFIHEKEGNVIDILLCHDLKIDSPGEIDNKIYFTFYKEDELNFTPSIEYLIRQQEADKAVEEFNNLESQGIVTIEELMHWYKKYNNLAEALYLKEPFYFLKFKAFIHIHSLYYEVHKLAQHYENNHLAESALKNYYQIDKNDEKNLCRWLLQYEKYYFAPFRKTKNWKKTGFLILNTQPKLTVDCHDYLAGSIFEGIYSSRFSKIMRKNQPTEQQYYENNGEIPYSLEVYLKLKNKYLDLFE